MAATTLNSPRRYQVRLPELRPMTLTSYVLPALAAIALGQIPPALDPGAGWFEIVVRQYGQLILGAIIAVVFYKMMVVPSLAMQVESAKTLSALQNKLEEQDKDRRDSVAELCHTLNNLPMVLAWKAAGRPNDLNLQPAVPSAPPAPSPPTHPPR